MSPNLRYYDLQKEKKSKAEIEAEAARPAARHFDFFLERKKEEAEAKVPDRERVHTADVARMTETMLNAKAGIYYDQLNAWRPDLMFRREKQCKLIELMPHLGYAAITSGTIPEADGSNTPWMLYFANFNTKFGKGEVLFEDVPKNYGISFFALALQMNDQGVVTGRDLRKRGNGVLFATKDPTEAFQSIAKIREIQKLWQMDAKRREHNSMLLGKMVHEPSTSTEIDLPEVDAPGPEDHLNLRLKI